MSTRRERIHDGIREEIKGVARKHMATQGAAAISLRAIARDMEMTAPALYRYYANRDELITALILDGFIASAQAMQEAHDSVSAQDLIGRLRAAMLAYREWAVTHPVDFTLIYGNPIPDYHQTPDVAERTGLAARQSFEVVGKAIQTAIEGGVLVPPQEYLHLPPTLEEQFATVIHRDGYGDATTTVLYLTMMAWAQGHGMIMLELNGHLQPTVPDVEAFYRHGVDDLLRQMGARTNG